MWASSDKIITRYKAMSRRGSIACDDAPGGRGKGRRIVRAQGDNPLCGDSLVMEALVEKTCDGEDAVRAVRFDGYGCSLCLASADMVAESVEGMKVRAALAFSQDDLKRAWGGLEIGRSRQACLELSVQVLHRALGGENDA